MTILKQTKTHNIYLVDKNKLSGLKDDPDFSISKALADLIDDEVGYKEQKLLPDIEDKGFSVCLYFREERYLRSKFSSFCKAFVEDNQEAVQFVPQNCSSVLFIWNNKHIYAIPTGQGFRVIEPYVMSKFGMIVASIYEKSFKVTALESNAMAGIVHSHKTVYAKEVDFIDENALDAVFKEITGRVNDESRIKELLNLPKKSKRKSVKLIAKDYVQFSSALNFNNLLHLLSIVDECDFEECLDRFNLIAPLKSKKNVNIVEENNSKVIEAIYEAVKKKQEIPFDLFHDNTLDYISAESYIYYDSAKEYGCFDDYGAPEALFSSYHNFLNGRPDTADNFTQFVKTIKIKSKKGDKTITDAPLLKHLSGEIVVNGINYFVFYGKYYKQNKTYAERLDRALATTLREGFFVSLLETRWEQQYNEDWFNKTVSEQEGYIHLHKIKVHNIEFADLLKIDNGVITIVHVKDGFDRDMRALDRQVELSVTKLIDIQRNNSPAYMKELYAKASKSQIGRNITAEFHTEEEFLACMKNKSFRYVIAIRPPGKGPHCRESLLKSQSNIAKHCLNAMLLRCFQQGVELKIQLL